MAEPIHLIIGGIPYAAEVPDDIEQPDACIDQDCWKNERDRQLVIAALEETARAGTRTRMSFDTGS